jgi:hypothetical protein
MKLLTKILSGLLNAFVIVLLFALFVFIPLSMVNP